MVVAGPLVYVDTSEVRPEGLEQLRRAVDELAEFVEANVPEVLSYNVYLSDDGSKMTVVHIHADSSSLEKHLEIGGPAFRRFADLVTLKSIHLYGEPSSKALEQLREKARSLGSGVVVVHTPAAGFSRLEPVATRD
jgi:Antibiotic biosynthesis monooxygenase